MLMEHRIVFCLCLMTEILAGMKTLFLAPQKQQGSLLVDIKHMVDITTDTLQKLPVTILHQNLQIYCHPGKVPTLTINIS